MMNDLPHKQLEVWKRSMAMVAFIYEQTKSFPREEEFGMKSQLRRAAVSVPSNIAEGLARKGKNERLHFLNIAQGSLSELDTQVEISATLGYFAREVANSIESRLVDIQKLLSGLVRKIRD